MLPEFDLTVYENIQSVQLSIASQSSCERFVAADNPYIFVSQTVFPVCKADYLIKDITDSVVNPLNLRQNYIVRRFSFIMSAERVIHSRFTDGGHVTGSVE